MALKEKPVCECPSGGIMHGKVDEANMTLIVRAVNCYDDLLGACEDAKSTLQVVVSEGDKGLQAIAGETLDNVIAAIAKAKSPAGCVPNTQPSHTNIGQGTEQ